jgi:hypothetical protein
VQLRDDNRPVRSVDAGCADLFQEFFVIRHLFGDSGFVILLHSLFDILARLRLNMPNDE